ncbi:Hypothetical protein PHPALM_9005 [Phytophthora palmivora]|uniref:PiggyBac transposable element-derived protein 4 C-terminal zinc-ribbon domain-containing protein n=1 Tax=Phytophthora palmivora TaxID=4796 RepID=A0A2P4Y8F4_9STRA|nr:Hypothetical protein PHPALM_9005 [Phytophthora palmivora]
MKKCGERVPTHAGYMRRLHLELMSVSAATFEANLNVEDLVSVPLQAGKHCLRNNNAKYPSKRRQHSCKVCFAMADPNTKSFESSYYCPTCENQRGGYCGMWDADSGDLRKNIRYRKRKREDPEEEDAAEERDVDYIDREGDSN